MRPLLFVMLVAACGGSSTTPARPLPDDPMGGLQAPLAVERLPGAPPPVWPLPVARAGDAWLAPWQDARLHARLVGLDGARDLDLDDGPLVGAAALADGFVVVAGDGGGLRVHFLDGSGVERARRALPAPGVPVAVAADGRRAGVLCRTELVRVDGAGDRARVVSATLALVGPDDDAAIDLGAVDSPPPLYGDDAGFVVGRLLVAPDGTVVRAPAATLPGTRLYRRAQPGGDVVSLDGHAWLDAGGTVTWAARGASGAAAVVDGTTYLGLADDGALRTRGLVPQSRRASSGWLSARAPDGALLWEGAVGDARSFAWLDGASLAPAGAFALVRPRSRAVVALASAHAALLAWLDDVGQVEYALFRR